MAIIGVLATLVLSSLSEARIRGRDSKILAEQRYLQTTIESYRLENNSVPLMTTGSTSALNCKGYNDYGISNFNFNFNHWENFISIVGVSPNEFPQEPEGTPCFFYHPGSGTCGSTGAYSEYALRFYTVKEISGSVYDSILNMYWSCVIEL